MIKRQYQTDFHDFGMILPFFLSRRHGHVSQHILHKDAVAARGVVDEDVGDGTHQLAVLQDRAAAQ